MAKLFNWLDNILKCLVVIGNGLMLLLVFGQVITRYCFGWTPYFGEELARYLFVWVVFLSLPLVARYGGHMAIETLTSRVLNCFIRKTGRAAAKRWAKSCKLPRTIGNWIFLWPTSPLKIPTIIPISRTASPFPPFIRPRAWNGTQY